MKTPPAMPVGNRQGFTLAEVITAVALLGITLTASVSSLVYVTSNEKMVASQGELDMDASLLVERLRRDLWRTSRDMILVHPPGNGPYQAISFPIKHGRGPILLDENGEIEWDATVIYHLKSGSPSEVRRTVFDPFGDFTAAQREQQLADVVADGNGDSTYNSENATTRVLIQNPVEWELNIKGIPLDAYAATASRKSLRLGTAIMNSGTNTVTFRAAAKNTLSSGYKLGVDTLNISASGLAREGEWQTVSEAVGVSPSVINIGSNETWSGNSVLGFPATQASNSFTLRMGNDRWEERNFFPGNANTRELSRVIVNPATAPRTYALRLDGNGMAWVATNQTRLASDGYSNMNDLTNVALRIFVRGSDLWDGYDGGWIVFNGTNVWARFARSSSAGMHIQKAFIAQSAVMLDPASNPMNIVSNTLRTFLFTNSVERDTSTALPSPFESDKLDYPIEKTNSYVIGILLSKNIYGNMRPAVYNNANDAGGPNCRLIINPTVDQADDHFDWSSLPTEELTESQWNSWNTALPDTVYTTRRIIALNSLRAGHASEGIYKSQIIDTQRENPDYQSFSWTATTPSNSVLEMKVLAASSTTNLGDAVNWTNVAAATSGSTPVINGRYAQVWARMQPGTDALSTPELQDFTLCWAGNRQYVDLSGIFSVGPENGIYEVLVNGALLLQNITVKVSVFKEIRLASGKMSRMESSAFAEIVPRN